MFRVIYTNLKQYHKTIQFGLPAMGSILVSLYGFATFRIVENLGQRSVTRSLGTGTLSRWPQGHAAGNVLLFYFKKFNEIHRKKPF